METIRILVVDDHPVIRQGLRSMLAGYSDMEVVGEAENGPQAVRSACATQPDVILLDIRLPGSNGVQVAQQLRRLCPEAKVLILTTYDEEEYLLGALRAGAHGYMLKNTRPEELAAAIRAINAGERLVSPGLINGVLQRFESLAKEAAKHEAGLTDAEIEILQCMAAGATNKEIAERQYWSEATVKRKTIDIYRKLGVADRAQAVAEAIRRGLI
ncbi:MAG: response regulator transcription factor [Chloroflexi bacterium]|nr:response regulator transcription factor [Chloroflexota bacterium]MCL5076125.1 response regulator transcription factor [Chloroflexota bacterium]